MANTKWFRLVLVAVLLVIVSSFTIGGNGCNFLNKEKSTGAGSSATPPPSEEYYLGLIPLPREQYDLIPMIGAPAGGIQGLPATYDISNNMPIPGNQYPQNSCVGWAVAYALKSYQEQDERNWGTNTDAHLFSPSYIYNQINGGRDRGANFPRAINILTAQGCATLATMPYIQNDYLTQPSQAAIAEAANYKCIIYRTVNIMDNTEIKGFLYSGAPLVIAIKVGENFDRIREFNNIYSSLGSYFRGWHAVTLVGYSNTKSAFKIINSWGTNWGDGGYGWIDYNFFPDVCREAYWVQDYVETQRVGSVAVYSTPSSAGVYLNDVYKGTTPITLISIPVGNYSLKISKTNYITQDIAVTIVENQVPDINVTLVAEALPPPTLISPSYGLATTDTTPDFDWSDIPGASAYGIMVDNNSDFSSPEINQTTTPSNYTPSTPLTEGTYYWKVKTQDGSDVWGNWSSPWLFTINQPVPTPSQVTSPNPADSAHSVITTTQLSWASADRATSYDVYFGTINPPSTLLTNTATTSYNPGTLSNSTTYYWRIDSRNSAGPTTGTVWSFITNASSTTAPAQVTSPNPLNGTTNLPITQQLSWAAASGATSYDVYFGTTSPGTFKGNQAGTGYDPGTLSTGTYYWRIDSKNVAGTTTGVVWSFTAYEPPPPPPLPDQVTSPSPSDGTTDVSTSPSLSWATAGNATSYDIYFGTNYPPSNINNGTNTTSTTYNPSTLANYTTYYWRIASRNETGTTDGYVWSFKTIGTATFNYTGSYQTWTVPAGVYSINVDARGAQGGAGQGNGGTGGKGARVQTTLPVDPGDTLYIYVGGKGYTYNTDGSFAGGYNGGGSGATGGYASGGGGGASDIRYVINTTYSDRVVIAGGGGGGGGGNATDYGGNGGAGGQNGTNGNNSADGATGGGGATQYDGGAGGIGSGSAGTFGVGGTGAEGGWGAGGGGGGGNRGGGGGGWWNGTNGGGGGGGGGSSFGQTDTTYSTGYRSGNGYIKITY